MSNKHKPHVIVLPEDDANRQIANGFLLDPSIKQGEPEPLRKQCGDSLENIGKALAAECYRDETSLWHHPLLAHNAAERARLNTKVKSILF